jgi:nicotinamidase-related amidase
MSLNKFPTARTVSIPEIPVETQCSLPAEGTAIVVIDMQNDFVRADGALHVEAAEATVEGIADLLDRGRAAGVSIVYTQDTHGEDDREFEIWPRHCVRGSRGWEIVDELSPRAGDRVIEKNRYDGFYATAMDHYLSHVLDIKRLVIVGTVANICVIQTAASAGLRWYEVITPADGISALTDFDQASTLRQISMLYYGTIVETIKDLTFH